jgi:hypothetical protein
MQLPTEAVILLNVLRLLNTSVYKHHSAITINTLKDQHKHIPVKEFENSSQHVFTLRSIFRLERSASDIEPFLYKTTRLAEKNHTSTNMYHSAQKIRGGFWQPGCKGFCFA